jgi:hypothetical protein
MSNAKPMKHKLPIGVKIVLGIAVLPALILGIPLLYIMLSGFIALF